jgi:hypothetical protein
MSFDVTNRYSPSHKPWDHVGNIIPDIEHSEGERPAVEFKVASWLPVQFYDKYYENWIVCMPGKAVGLDPDGCVVPAEFGLAGATVTYTTNDVLAGTIDIATGLPVSTAKVVDLTYLTGIEDPTWSKDTAGVGTVTSGFMGRFGRSFADAVCSYPIGVAPYAYLQWAGGDGSNPSAYRLHNYNMQHQVAVLCDYVIKLPLVPAVLASEGVSKSVISSGAAVFGTPGWYTRVGIAANATGRYDDATGHGVYPIDGTMPIIARVLDHYPAATNTLRTPIAFTSTVDADKSALSALTAYEVGSLKAIKSAGDFWVDLEVGVIFMYSADGASLPGAVGSASGTVTLSYYRYDNAASTVSKFASVMGDASFIKPGDFLKVGADSNYYLAAPGTTIGDIPLVMGQVLGFETYPRDGLDRVKTAFNPAINTSAAGSYGAGNAGSSTTNLGQMDRMPGSATGGVTDAINFAGAADTMVIINLTSR